MQLNQLKEKIGDRFTRDVGWNLGSLAVLAVSGLVLNIVIGRFYGATTLGTFNQVYAVFVVASQFSTLGIQYSVLTNAATYHDDRAKLQVLLGSALLLNITLATIITLIVLFSAPLLARLLESPDTANGVTWVAAGLWCFTLNKTMLAYINGLRHMRTFAVAQASRYLLILCFLIVFTVQEWHGSALPAIISGAEIILLIHLLGYIFMTSRPTFNKDTFLWIKKHFQFGVKGFISGAASTINSRVDVLMLGYFASDALVGIYSAAAMLLEGFTQLAVAVRNNLNPIITKKWSNGKLSELAALISRSIRYNYIFLGLAGVLAILCFPIIIKILDRPEFVASMAPFVVLMIGRILSIGIVPVNMLLVQTGFPGWHTLLLVSIIFINIALNALLIPMYLEIGAAAATAMAFVSSVLLLKVFAKKVTGIPIRILAPVSSQ